MYSRGHVTNGRQYQLEFKIDGLVALVASLSKVGVHNQLSYLHLLVLSAVLLQSMEHTYICMVPYSGTCNAIGIT